MTSLTVVSGLDAADQAVVTMNLQCDLPATAAVRIAIDAAEHQVRWWVSDLGGLVETGAQEVAHPCVSCSMREVIIPALTRLAGTGRWENLVVDLPAGAEALPLANGIDDAGPDPLDLRACVHVVSGDDLCSGVFDDPLLDELGLALLPEDRRSYGEVLVAGIEFADVIVLARTAPDRSDQALLAHLARPGAAVVRGLTALDAGRHLPARRDHAAALAAVDPRRRHATGAAPGGHIVTLELETWRPFHPDRLLDLLPELGAGDVRGRGAFWLPGRPGIAIAWESAGGQCSIGTIGPWGEGDAGRRTRLVLTTDEERAPLLRQAFEQAVMTEAETVHARARWMGRPDGFEDWLGDVGDESSVA